MKSKLNGIHLAVADDDDDDREDEDKDESVPGSEAEI